jgi:glycerol-3-phosphate dehydrogenase
MADLGRDFGGGLYECEVNFLRREEWAVDAEDILWRRTKCGLHMTAEARAAFADYMESSRSG